MRTTTATTMITRIGMIRTRSWAGPSPKKEGPELPLLPAAELLREQLAR